MKRECNIRIIGYASNKKLLCDVYMIRKCNKCNAILEFLSSQVSNNATKNTYTEYVICPNCSNKVIVLQSKKGD